MGKNVGAVVIIVGIFKMQSTVGVLENGASSRSK
jgi:hypothetical protein